MKTAMKTTVKASMWFLIALCFFAFNETLSFAAESSKSQQSMIGKVESVTNNEITLTADDGKMRKFGIKPAQREEIKRKDLKQGDRVSLMFNQKNQLTGIDKLNMSPGPGLTPAPSQPHEDSK